jgi:translocation and assembly module TamB
LSRHIYKLYLICAFFICSTQLYAQDVGKSYLESLLESTLSSPDMMVSVTGLEGTFSSSAKVAKINISDSEGLWLSIENAELDWTRSALLQKRVEIETLSAGKITVFRKSVQSKSTPSPEAGTFRVPELPVSVNIQNITAKVLVLKKPILGRAARLSLNGRVEIANENFDVALKADNLDQAGVFNLKAVLDTREETILLSLKAEEGANGLIANALDIPNKPSLSINLMGQGPQIAFKTDIHVSTNGTDRLAGQVLISPNVFESKTDGVQITAELAGNLAPLFETQYQRFFGEHASLSAIADWRKNGEISISDLDIKTAALSIEGQLDLASDRTPTRFNLKTSIKSLDDLPVLLPLTGPETHITSVDLALDYDVQRPWSGSLQVMDLSRDGLSVGDIKLEGSGEIPNAFSIKAQSDLLFSAKLKAIATSITHTNTDLDQAIGKDIRATGNVIFKKGEPVLISDLMLSDGNISAGFDGEIEGLETALQTSGELSAEITDISVLSKIVAQDLKGEFNLSASGHVAPLTGALDLDIETIGNAVSFGNSGIDPLIKGTNTANVSIKRTEDGFFFDKLVLLNPQLSAEAGGHLQGDQAIVNLSARVNDMSVISDALTGPLSVDGSLNKNGDIILVLMKSKGIGGLQADVSGTIPVTEGAWNLRVKGLAPLALADQVLTSSSAKARGTAQFNLALNGSPSLQNISGKISTNGASITLPTQSLSVDDIMATANITKGIAITRVSASLSTGGQVTSEGQISLNQQQGFPTDLKMQLINIIQRDRNFYKTTLNGNTALTGPLLFGPKLSGQINLTDTELNLQGAAAPKLSFIPEIIHINEQKASRVTRQRAGLIATADTGAAKGRALKLDVVVNSPTRIFIRGRGLDAELGGQVRLTGTTQSVAPIGAFNLIRGRLDILGKRLTLTDGNISLAGALDPRIRIVAATNSDEYELSVIISGLLSDPQFTFGSSPDLPEDEVVAQIFFGRGLDQISPFQAFQLAAAVRELTGKGGRSIGERIRSKLNIDDFSIETSADGTTGARAGKYISENVYTDVTIAGNGKSEISINLDLNKNLSTSGAVTQSGGSKLGIFFKKDY